MKRGLSFTILALLGLLASVAMAMDNNWSGAAFGCVAAGGPRSSASGGLLRSRPRGRRVFPHRCSSRARRRSTFPRVKFLSRVLTALNLLPSIATLAFVNRPIRRVHADLLDRWSTVLATSTAISIGFSRAGGL